MVYRRISIRAAHSIFAAGFSTYWLQSAGLLFGVKHSAYAAAAPDPEIPQFRDRDLVSLNQHAGLDT